MPALLDAQGHAPGRGLGASAGDGRQAVAVPARGLARVPALTLLAAAGFERGLDGLDPFAQLVFVVFGARLVLQLGFVERERFLERLPVRGVVCEFDGVVEDVVDAALERDHSFSSSLSELGLCLIPVVTATV